jgi:hypothetical protein
VRRIVLALLVAFAGAARAVEPSPVSVVAHVEPEQPTIGQPFRYVLDVSVRPGTEVVVAQPAERLGDFDIVDFGIGKPVERAGRTVMTRWWRLVGWSPGEHVIESPAVRYRLPGEALHDAEGDPTRVAVASVLGDADESADIRDIKGPEPVPPARWPWLLLGAALGTLGLALLAIRVVRRRRQAATAAPALRPAHEVAADALRVLRGRRLPELGEFKEFYASLSGIVRRYLEDRFAVRAPEMTTEEFLAATARGGALEPAHRTLLGGFLAESDLVKFARHLPTLDDSERAFAAAERFVGETAVRDRLPEEGVRAAG